MVFTPYYTFRDSMVERLRVDLLGPESSEEVLLDRPAERYIVGILFPQYGPSKEEGSPDDDIVNHSSLERDPSEDYNESFEEHDSGVSMANVKYPSSMGMSFTVDANIAGSIKVFVEAARYARHIDDQNGVTWRRLPLVADPVVIDVTKSDYGKRKLSVDGLELFVRIRPARKGRVACTVVLINSQRSTSDIDMRNELAFFQPVIRVVGAAGASPFVDRRQGQGTTALESELRSQELLYRHAYEFAVGHGCSVDWKAADAAANRVAEIYSEFIPAYELALSDSNPEIPTEKLSMKAMSLGTRDEVCAALEQFCDGYANWIDTDLKAELTTAVPGHLFDVAQKHIKQCQTALKRMHGGVDLLRTDERVWTAFQLMNAAMLRQRAVTDWHRDGRPHSGIDESKDHRWRPFQIGFILLCLSSLAIPEHEDRSITDLLWFPTGGGKTEAYLGLIAFAIFNRRLREPEEGHGVTAIMRYTLRLLTIQQFQRATLLICACEQVRREQRNKINLGHEPISIGLWLGRDATPNTRKQTRDSLEKLRRGESLTRMNPRQLEICPWCGEPLGVSNYFQHRDTRTLIIACRNRKCDFKEGLPLYLVDEDIYAAKPSLIIATVDKFATMPWRDSAKALFNLDSPSAPPELIIQDELHLISGPLGTLTGLYESAVAALCTRNGIGPKVIASTATIRRADDQVTSLFGTRTMKQFPPVGLDARQSYFAVESSKATKGTRLYVGVMAPSTSNATLLVRTYASLLNSAYNLPGTTDVRDQYWTLVGYFSSLRVLGAASMQVRDDVALRLEYIARWLNERLRKVDELVELTSNVPGPDIPQRLRQIEVKYGTGNPDLNPVDVLLATNMISVGVDIDRLGLMAVMGQPQSASEYIQATSRVGRQFPGLVVTMLNAARSRDRSHYESFQSFHQAMYRQVESTSVTPFSARARDRALHAVLVSIVRLSIPQMSANEGAAKVEKYESAIRNIISDILERVDVVAPWELEATAEQLEELLQSWISTARKRPDLLYEDENLERSLLVSASDERAQQYDAFPTMWSFRDVDKESVLFYVSERVD